MPLIKVGITAANFGMNGEVFGLMQTFSEGLDSTQTDLKDEDGNIVGSAYSSMKGSQDVEIIVTDGNASWDTLAALGAPLTLTNGGFIGFLRNWRNSFTNEGYTKLTGTTDIFPDFA